MQPPIICPHCATRLRIRDEMFIGRAIGCPECGQAILIVSGPDGLMVQAVAAEPAETEAAALHSKRDHAPAKAHAGKQPAKKTPSRRHRRETPKRETQQREAPTSRLAGLMAQPLLLGAIAGGSVCAVAVVFVALSWGSAAREIPQPVVRTEPEPAVADRSESPKAAAGNSEPQPSANDSSVAAAGKELSETEQRLLAIGEELQAFVDEQGYFPAGTRGVPRLDPKQRLSWLATLVEADTLRSSPPVVWDRAWNDPLNELFVRRRLDRFQNPAVVRLTGSDGYPATHFVGMAGVGADARSLPVDHRRAGVFGDDRLTHLDDIRDGLSQTLLVVGVQKELGAWGAGGPATVRGLVQEPYVNGPDGFGTGQPDSMFVLMADGSVRTVTTKTSPRLVRRMAAMADGLPFDDQSPGEPGDLVETPLAMVPGNKGPDDGVPGARPARGEPKTTDQMHAEARDPTLPLQNQLQVGLDDLPLEPLVAEESPEAPVRRTVAEIRVALQQPILRFEQSSRTPLKTVLFQVAEMTGVPLVWDVEELGPAQVGLDQPVSLRLERTTVGEILERILLIRQLRYEIEDGRIRILPGGDAGKGSTADGTG